MVAPFGRRVTHSNFWSLGWGFSVRLTKTYTPPRSHVKELVALDSGCPRFAFFWANLGLCLKSTG